jgi:hypothetical protein
MLSAGIRFEAILNATFSRELAEAERLGDARQVYMLHEVGEETCHQRAFLRLIEQVNRAPTTRSPFRTWRAAHNTSPRRALRYEATRPILSALRSIGAFRGGRVPRAWQMLCGVESAGELVADMA